MSCYLHGIRNGINLIGSLFLLHLFPSKLNYFMFFFNRKIPTLIFIGLYISFIVFFLYSKFTYHELWKDEWQAWLMARDMGWGELLGSLYYEGHPALWYLYLKVWSLLSYGGNDELFIQLAHASLIIGAYTLVWFRFQIPIWLKGLILLSYYPFFEYGIVSRGYAFVMLIGFAIALLLPKVISTRDAQGSRNLKILALLFFLFCQTEVYAVMMAGALLFYIFLEKNGLQKFSSVMKDKTFSTLMWSCFGGVIIFLISVFPRTNEVDLSRAYLSKPLSGEIFFKGFQGMLANTFWIGSIPDTNVFGVNELGLIFSVLVVSGLIYLFRKERNILYTVLFFMFGYFIFLITIYTGGVRQWGMFFIFFLMLLQLFFLKINKSDSKLDLLQTGFLLSIFIFQIHYSYLAMEKEINHPFSNAKMTAEFIKKDVPEKASIVAINKFEIAPVVGYANRKFYSLPEGETFTFFKWVEKVYLPSEKELQLFADYKKVNRIIIISPQKLDNRRYPNALLWKSFDNYSVKNENYYLYTLGK